MLKFIFNIFDYKFGNKNRNLSQSKNLNRSKNRSIKNSKYRDSNIIAINKNS